MKVCPRCRRTYTDESLKFCRDDGATLVSAPASGETATRTLDARDEASTRLFVEPQPTAPTETLSAATDAARTGELAPARAKAAGVGRRASRRAVVAFALVAALVLVACVVFYLSRGGAKPGASSSGGIGSIAVLPFANAGGNADAEYLSDGISESIINSLSQISSLRVVPRSTVFRFKGQQLDPQEIGRKLGVQAVVTGRVMQHGDTLSVQTELVDVDRNSQLWGSRYERKLSDLLAVQSEIARQISEQLRMQLTGEERERVARRYTDNAEAYRLYLEGRHAENKFTKEGYEEGIDYFERAIRLDPNFALAYVGIAEAYIISGDWYLPDREAMPKAREAAKKALSIDDKLADAHALLAWTLWIYDWDLAGAQSEFDRAFALDPNMADSRGAYAQFLLGQGKFDDALREARLAQQLDPLGEEVNTEAGLPLYFSRRYDEAIAQYRKAVEVNPDFWYSRFYLAMAYEQKGDYASAISEFRRANQIADVPETTAGLAHVYAVSGRKDEAQKVLSELEEQAKSRYVSPYDFAVIYAGLGERDRAFERLEGALEDRSAWAPMYLKIDPRFDTMRGDPRFADLLRQISLTP